MSLAAFETTAVRRAIPWRPQRFRELHLWNENLETTGNLPFFNERIQVLKTYALKLKLKIDMIKNLTYSLHIFTTESTSGSSFLGTRALCDQWILLVIARPRQAVGLRGELVRRSVSVGPACHQPLKTWESEPVSLAAESLALMSFQRSLFYTSRLLLQDSLSESYHPSLTCH